MAIRIIATKGVVVGRGRLRALALTCVLLGACVVPPVAHPAPPAEAATNGASPVPPHREPAHLGIAPGDHVVLSWLPPARGEPGRIVTQLPNHDVFRGSYSETDPETGIVLPSGFRIPHPRDARPRRALFAVLRNEEGMTLRCAVAVHRPGVGAWSGERGYCETDDGLRFEARME